MKPMAQRLCMVFAPLLACGTLLAQEPISPVSRTASISAFADGQSSVLFERRYRAFDAAVEAGEPPASQARAQILAGPAGALAFDVSASLNATATDVADGRATAFATDNLSFSVDQETPFTLSAAFERGAAIGAAGSASSVRLEVDGAGSITLADGSVASSVILRASTSPRGDVATGRLAAGRYRFRVEASVNAAAVGGDASVSLEARGLLATTCHVDLTLDGVIDLFDFLEFQILQDRRDPRADFDGDGEFTVFDLLAFIQLFDDGC